MNRRARKIPRKSCPTCGFVMLDVEFLCLACEDRAEREYTRLRELAYLRSTAIPR